jgi:hypothetical protein
MEMCAEILYKEIVPELSCKSGRGSPPVYLAMPYALSQFSWQGGSLKALTKELVDHVRSISHPARSIRVSVHQKRKMRDLEQFFFIFPSSWLQLSIECQSLSGLETGAQRVLERLGCHCPEWVGVEGSESQLGAFYLGTQKTPALILYVQNRGARRNCDILIPEFR